MIENIHRSQRRGQITRVIAPIKLSQWHRKVVLSRMAHLCSPCSGQVKVATDL